MPNLILIRRIHGRTPKWYAQVFIEVEESIRIEDPSGYVNIFPFWLSEIEFKLEM